MDTRKPFQTLTASDLLCVVEHVVKEIDPHKTGFRARIERQRHGLTLREVARRMDVSAAYVSDIERGNRGWTIKLAIRYLAALEETEGIS